MQMISGTGNALLMTWTHYQNQPSLNAFYGPESPGTGEQMKLCPLEGHSLMGELGEEEETGTYLIKENR